MPAQVGHRGRLRWLGGDPVVGYEILDQLNGLAGVEQGRREVVRTVDGGSVVRA